MTKDSRIDAYISKSADFAKPILEHLRKLIHQACPEVEETIKWGFPHFDYKGMMCSMASFKNHCAFGFWKGSIMNDPYHLMDKEREKAMGHFGRISSLAELPADKIIIEYIKQAVKLNDENIKLPSENKTSKATKELVVPSYFIDFISKNKKALQTFENFSNSHKKEYVEWIIEAKTEATKIKRMEAAVEWMTERKSRNWKYIKK